MNNLEITSVLKRDTYAGRVFGGVYPRNKLPRYIKKRPIAFVINTDHSDGPGEHWVGVWFDRRGRAEYFDSFGFPPILHEDIEQFIFRNSQSCRYNSRWLQDETASNCGFYVLYFILRKSRGVTMDRLLSPFNPRRVIHNDQTVIRRVYWMTRR
eukprot:TRINITY_DN24483_c1_g2_i1.p5 TRINITY_DN24483_c1_g2~~TRINITY_DN24483_c1_g2_i1.p5  ORF type:complete len:154 (+),score=7.34 TRINITY_DN24483_c1_g2_i1:3583-4044(+)